MYDVIVVGAGNAATAAALSAKENGAKVIILEKAPQSLAGGNTSFAVLGRFPYKGVEEVREFVPDISEAEIEQRNFPPTTEEDFYRAIMAITRDEADSALTEVIVHNANDTWKWILGFGVKFIPFRYAKQMELVTGKLQPYDGLPIEFSGGGLDYNIKLREVAEHKGIEILYETQAVKLLAPVEGERRVQGVRILHEGQYKDVPGKGVVLACGGFESNPEMRAKYLGPGWDLVRVRGTRYNTGDGISMALELGAQVSGHWSGCHASAEDATAPKFGDSIRPLQPQRVSYPAGITLNLQGERFFDEGEDFHPQTYAKVGKEILRQPGSIAIQLFDSKAKPLLMENYQYQTPIVAKSVDDLAAKLPSELGLNIDSERAVQTIRAFNRAAQGTEYNLAILDRKGTKGLTPPKSNWAVPLDKPPLYAYPVQCGITYTFGGLRVDTKARVLDTTGHPIKGLYAAGEIVGFWYHNYVGGAGLTLGAVLGKIAGAEATVYGREQQATQ